jgi:hypothetical protein
MRVPDAAADGQLDQPEEEGPPEGDPRALLSPVRVARLSCVLLCVGVGMRPLKRRRADAEAKAREVRSRLERLKQQIARIESLHTTVPVFFFFFSASHHRGVL